MGKAGGPVDREALEFRRRRALELLRRGYSQAAVAKSVGMSTTWVSRLVHDTGLPTAGAEIEEKRQRALSLLGQGHSHAVVATKVGMSKSWVGRLARARSAADRER